MYELDISDYAVSQPKGTPGGKASRGTPYNVRERLRDLLLHPALQLTGADIYARLPLVAKIVESKEKTVELDKGELSVIKTSFETLRGFSATDAPLITRVFDLFKEIKSDEDTEAAADAEKTKE